MFIFQVRYRGLLHHRRLLLGEGGRVLVNRPARGEFFNNIVILNARSVHVRIEQLKVK